MYVSGNSKNHNWTSKTLKLPFEKYYFKPEEENNWILNPFEELFQTATSLSIVEKENLIELSSDTTLKRNNSFIFG